jgi:hypothetical protein
LSPLFREQAAKEVPAYDVVIGIQNFNAKEHLVTLGK